MVQIQRILISNLKRLRKLRKFTQERAATECQLSLRYYQNLEAGDRWPSPEIVRKIAAGFSVKQSDLFIP